MDNDQIILNEDLGDSMARQKVMGSIGTVMQFFSQLYQMIKFQLNQVEDKELSKNLTKAFQNHPDAGKYKGFKIKVKIIPVSAINAFVSPLSTTGTNEMSVFIYGGLVNVVGRKSDELMAVGLHEIGHYLKLHIPQRMYAGIVVQVGFAALIKWLLGNVKSDRKFQAILIGALIIMANMTVTAGMAFFSRMHEKQADQFAIDAGYGQALASALDKMRKFGTYSALKTKCGKACQVIEKIDKTFASHPETRERVQDILKRSETLKALKSRNKKDIQKVTSEAVLQIAKEYAWEKNVHYMG